MILTRHSDSQSPSGQLWEMLAKAVAMGADAVELEREGQIHDVRVETYESFGERCYRLNMGKGKQTERQTIDKNKTG